MFNETLLLEKSELTFNMLKKESSNVFRNPTKLRALKKLFEENRINGHYDFSKFECDNEICRTAAIINYINTPAFKSDKNLFSHNSTNLNLECMLTAFLKHPVNAKSVEFLEDDTDNGTYVLKLDGGECLDFKNERIENFDLQDLIVVTELF